MRLQTNQYAHFHHNLFSKVCIDEGPVASKVSLVGSLLWLLEARSSTWGVTPLRWRAISPSEPILQKNLESSVGKGGYWLVGVRLKQ
jgi:hypothetical protein